MATSQRAEGSHRMVTTMAAGLAPDAGNAIVGGHKTFPRCALIFHAHPLYRHRG